MLPQTRVTTLKLPCVRETRSTFGAREDPSTQMPSGPSICLHAFPQLWP